MGGRSDDDHGSAGGADHSASFGCVVALCVLAGVATLAHIGDSEEQLEYSHQRESVSDKGYKEGRIAQATFRGGEVEGLVVFREGNVGDPTKIVVGISGLEWLEAGEEGFEWYLSGGADRACAGGRFEAAELPLNTLLSEEPGSGWDMAERHGALEPMALAPSGSVVARYEAPWRPSSASRTSTAVSGGMGSCSPKPRVSGPSVTDGARAPATLSRAPLSCRAIAAAFSRAPAPACR